jgi:hypothetical protein
MDLGSLFAILALAVLVTAFIARPFFERATTAPDAPEMELSVQQAELERVLGLIQDLDMDYAMAKVLAEDYKAARPELVRRGAELMREIDRVGGTNGHRRNAGDVDLDSEIEAEVARLRGGAGAAPAGFCGRCGQAALAGDKFCVRCGAPLAVEGAGA